jgi:hypothetical protein
VSEDLKLPEFGPIDSEGFRSVCFVNDEGTEVLRLSLHMERYAERYTRAASNPSDYTANELNCLRTAAAIAAARHGSIPVTVALEVMLQFLIPESVTRQIEAHFPALAREALNAVNLACAKYAIRGIVQSNHVSPIYDDTDASLLLDRLSEAIRKGFLGIKAGRQAEVQMQLADTSEAIRRLMADGSLRGGETPTQKQVADVLKTKQGERTLRTWAHGCELTWEQFVRASEYLARLKEAETN